jgi:hypothetical protein
MTFEECFRRFLKKNDLESSVVTSFTRKELEGTLRLFFLKGGEYVRETQEAADAFAQAGKKTSGYDDSVFRLFSGLGL